MAGSRLCRRIRQRWNDSSSWTTRTGTWVAKRRGDHNRLGFALQLVTVRWLGTFLTDPLDVPLAVLDYVAAQVEVADPSCVKRYTERQKTRLEHQWEIAQVGGFVSFASAQEQLVERLDRRAWTTGDGRRRCSPTTAADLSNAQRPAHPSPYGGPVTKRKDIPGGPKAQEKAIWRCMKKLGVPRNPKIAETAGVLRRRDGVEMSKAVLTAALLEEDPDD